MGVARAFLDLHTESAITGYNGDDFLLIVPNDPANTDYTPIWCDGASGGGQGSIDESTYTDFQTGINGENSINRQAIAFGNAGIPGGYTNRDNDLDTTGGYLVGIGMLSYTFMDNSSGIVDPSAYVLQNNNYNLFTSKFNYKYFYKYGGEKIFIGRMFCTSQGKPKIETIDATDYIGFGLTIHNRDGYGGRPLFEFTFLKPLTYPNAPTNQLNTNNAFDIDSLCDTIYSIDPIDYSDFSVNRGSDIEYQIETGFYQVAIFQDGVREVVDNLPDTAYSKVDAIFSSYYTLPLYAGIFTGFGDRDQYDDLVSNLFSV